jgi:hypothetical protein
MMTAQAIGLFFEGEPVEISVPDCSLIPELELTQQMAQCSPQRLEVGDMAKDPIVLAHMTVGPQNLAL